MQRIPDLDLEELWSLTRGHEAITVAILDGPVDTGHPCLAGASMRTASVGSTKASGSSESFRHGTHVASGIFSDGSCGLRGIVPDCRALWIPVFAGTPDGGLVAASQMDLARAIRLAADEGARVINLSGGQLSRTPEADQFLTDALRYCEDKNVLVVAAAGNDGCECLHVPAAISTVLAVGAYDPATGKHLEFSNWGAEYRGHGILAPGRGIPGAQAGDGIVTRSGTSFAAPIVSGVAALLLSIQKLRGEEPNVAAVRKALIEGATGCDDTVAEDCRPYLAGTLNPRASLRLLGSTPSEVPAGAEAQTRCSSVAPNEIHSHSGDRPGPDRLRPAEDPSPAGLTHSAGRPFDTKENEMQHEQMDISGEQMTEAVAPSSLPPEVEATGVEPLATELGAGSAMVEPSGDCGCSGSGTAAPQLAFALGELGYDLVTEARKDSLWQAMSDNPYDWRNLAKHLEEHPWDAEAVTWTLRIDATPIYAIHPVGAYASETYGLLAKLLIGQIEGKRNIERISVPGQIAGSTRLTNGITVPVLVPTMRGIFAWDTESLVKAVKKSDASADGVQNFLERVYYELRNMGQSPQERALNFAATNAFQVSTVFHEAAGADHELDQIEVHKSPICRQDSDCWDVMLTFFDPSNDRAARKVHRFTVDVSDVVPCTVGRIRTWSIR